MILVTGGTGFVGKSIVSRLLAEGHQIRLLARDTKTAAEIFPKAEIIEGNVLDPSSLEKACKNADIIIHLASIISYQKDRTALREVNVDGTKNLLSACKSAKRFIFSSSVSVYGPVDHDTQADETYRLKPDTEYGRTKLEAEDLVRESRIDYVALRMAPIYGPESPIWKKILGMMDRRFPIPKNNNLTHVVHIDDVTEAFMLSLKKGYGVYNIADRKPIGFTELAAKLSNLLGKEPRFWPPWLIKAAAIPLGLRKSIDTWSENRHYIIAKAESELGFRPKADMDAKLKEMAGWYRGLKPAQTA